MKISKTRKTEKNNQTGDTIVEVIFAFVVLSALTMGIIAIMNRGTATIQRSLEISLVRQQIDSQAEALRYLNNHYLKSMATNSTRISQLWRAITSGDIRTHAYPSVDPNASRQCPTIDVSRKNFFFFFKSNHNVNSSTDTSHMGLKLGRNFYNGDDISSYAQINSSIEPVVSSSIWINSVKTSAMKHHVDFIIQACWHSPGATMPIRLSTVVRLYDPSI